MPNFIKVVCEKEGKGWTIYYKNGVVKRHVKQEIASLIFASLPTKKVKKKVYSCTIERNGINSYYSVEVA